MTSTASTLEIRPFRVEFPQADLDDLRDRLERTRFAPAAPGDSWDYGTPTSYLRDMVERWKAFDWREVEDRLNAHPNFLTEIDGQTDPLHPRPVRGARRPAAAARAHLPGLGPRLPRHDRAADRPGRPRRPAPRTRSTS